MKIAITWSDSFIAPYIVEMLGPSAVVVPNEILGDQMALDAMLTPCSALIHINSWTTMGADRDDDVAYRAMREKARPVLDAVDRHGGLHMIILGTLRVYPQWDLGLWASSFL